MAGSEDAGERPLGGVPASEAKSGRKGEGEGRRGEGDAAPKAL